MMDVTKWTKKQRLGLGVFVLVLVDVIWVASSELTRFIFDAEHFDKPYFTTYFKTSMFTSFLIGFLTKSWRRMVCPKNGGDTEPLVSEDEQPVDPEEFLGEPVYVPVKSYEESASDHNHSDGDVQNGGKLGASSNRHVFHLVGASGGDDNKAVRFSRVSEVRHLSDSHAEDATMSRLSYEAYLAAEERRREQLGGPLPVSQVAHLAIMFCLLWFLGNYAYQAALKATLPAVVNVISSTSSFFTIILAAIFPGSVSDRFNLTKFLAVMVSFGGVVLVSLSDGKLEGGTETQFGQHIPWGAIWALLGALCYSLYLVLLRRRVDREDRLSLPMFFAFVGLFCALLLWPGFFIVHYTNVEHFQMPNATQWAMMSVNGIVGTLASELLWLWGCFLTSSLLATLSLSLTIPMTMAADFVLRGNTYDWMFYVGSIPIFLGFIIVAVLSHREHVDPVWGCLRILCWRTSRVDGRLHPRCCWCCLGRRALAAEPAPYRGGAGRRRPTERYRDYGESSDQTVGLLDDSNEGDIQ